jgi:hypothetical protein
MLRAVGKLKSSAVFGLLSLFEQMKWWVGDVFGIVLVVKIRVVGPFDDGRRQKM